MADAEVEFLLENLQQLLLYHVHLIKDVKEQLEQLEGDLRLFKAFLRDSSKTRRGDDSLRELACQIRDVVYKAEDVIDAFVTRATESRSRSYFVRTFHTPFKLLTIANEVDKVGSKVRDIYGDIRTFDFASLNVGSQESEAPRVRQENVVGFEDEASEIIRYLTQETEKPDVITLVGMPGIGKTTLARKIFDDPVINCEFPTRIWVHVSNDFSEKNVFLAILRQFTIITEDVEDKSEKDLHELVLSHLEKAKFLIVLDDVWSDSDWNSLRIAVPTSKIGKVLITSCSEEVGQFVHRVRFLTETESWELLQLEVFGKKTECPPELQTVGKLIAKQCAGLPLAIVTMGGILVRENLSCVGINAMKTAWTKACQSVPGYRNKNFYDKMPTRLQRCFLYLAAFPYDFEIRVGRLIRMWIAEGFVERVNGVRLEETAESYVKNLISRNLLKVSQMKDDGRVKTCRIHRMLHEFCKSEAGHARENVVTEIMLSDDGVFEPPLTRVSECRRLSIHSNVLEFLSSRPFGPRTRAFVCLSKDKFSLTSEMHSTIPGAFKLLRVLDAKPIQFSKLPSDIYHLVHLRYLALSLNVRVLPGAFVKLWNIQTLLVDTTSRSLDIKVDIFEFTQLRHFKTNAAAILCKPGKSGRGGEELQSLGLIAPESCTEAVLDKARNLKKLGIRGRLLWLLDEMKGSFDCLEKLRCLENLKLVNDVFPLSPSEGRLHNLPPAYKFPSSLKKLTLDATFLDWSQMSTLTRLDNLEVLKLKDNAFVGRIWETNEIFRSLEALHIGRTDLVIWVASAYQFPRLESLKLRYCEQLQEVPIELADIRSFKTLDLFVTQIAAASAERFLKKKDAKEFRLSIYPPSSI